MVRMTTGLLLLAFSAAGCMPYNSSEAIKPLSADLAKTAKIGAISVRSVPANVAPAFQSSLEAALRKRMDGCAKGTVVLDLDVAVSEVKVRNIGRAILIGDSSVIKGQARLTKDGQTVGDYDISHSVGGGGILTAAAMADEKILADDFAVEVCDRAFPPKPLR